MHTVAVDIMSMAVMRTMRRPYLSAEMTEYDAAHRAGDVPHGKHHEGLQQLGQRIGFGKERSADVLRKGAEHHEVVELERPAQAREDDDAPLGTSESRGRGRRNSSH